MAVYNRSQYEQGYPVTTTYYNPNPSAQGYPSSTNPGAQPSLNALYNRSTATPITNYSTGSTSASTKKSTAKGSSSSSKAKTTSSGYTNTNVSTGYDIAPKTAGVEYDILTGLPLTQSNNEPSFDATAAYRKLIDAYKGQQNNYQSYLNEMNNLAQSQYDRGMSSLNDIYNQQVNLLGGSYDTQRNTLAENLDRAKNALRTTYNQSVRNVSNDAENSLKQAYISNMLAKRNIAQQLSAMGLNGGMTETTLAGLANNYGNQRNSINAAKLNNLSNLEGNFNNSLSDLEGNYSSELANALQAYNTSLANANSQKLQQILALEDALANNKMNVYSTYQNMLDDYNRNYYDLLKSAAAAGADISY